MPPDERQMRRWETYRRLHPDRAVVIEEIQASLRDGRLVAESCAVHGPMSPRYRWPDGHVGWICYPCQRGAIDAP
jgi:hypothetical protein